jgi:hypothetical protein
MEKIGMMHSAADDFDHPALPDGHPLRRHVLYRFGCPKLVQQGLQSDPGQADRISRG